MKDILKDIENRFQVTDIVQQKERLAFATVDKSRAIALITWLKETASYSSMTLITAVDWLEDGVFQLTYLINDPTTGHEIGIRVMIDREEATMESAHHLWKNAKTYQRELKEMYGIDFPGSPGVDEGFNLEGWDEMPPNRRDFDTKEYAEKTFFPRPGRKTNDPTKYMKSKLYPNK
jgi:NADH-quinone oxidoreductase subunit C